MPKYSLRSDAPPSLYNVPKKKDEEEGKEHKKRAKVVLSTTTKADKRKKKKEGESEHPDKMEVDKEDEAADEKDKKDDDKKEDKKDEEEATFEVLQNPARVTLGQLSVLSFSEDKRYVPVKPVWTFSAQCRCTTARDTHLHTGCHHGCGHSARQHPWKRRGPGRRC